MTVHDGRVVGLPLVDYVDTESNIEALSNLEAGMTAYGSDTGRLGVYNTAWRWFDFESGSVLNEPGGFPNRTDSAYTFTAGSRAFDIAPDNGSFDVWQQGIKYVITADPDTLTIADTSGVHVIYYDAGVLSQIVNPSHAQLDDIYINKCAVAIIYWNATLNTAPIVADERHGTIMSGKDHERVHDTRGAAYVSGLGLSGYTLDTETDAALTFEITDGEIYDEDLEFEIEDGNPANPYEQQLNGGDAEIPILYRDDVDGTWMEDAATTLPYKSAAGGDNLLAYNKDDGDGTFSQVEVTNGRWVSMTLIATDDEQYPIKAIQGQNEYTSIQSGVEDAAAEVLSFGNFPTPETVILYRFVLRTRNTYGGSKQAFIERITDFRGSQISGAANVVQDHGSLGGLSDDDHSGHPWLLGRSGGQSLTGGVDAGDDLVLLSTAHGTKGTINLGTLSAYDQVNDRLGLGVLAPDAPIDIRYDTGLYIGAGSDLQITIASDDVYIKNVTQNRDIYLNVNDGGVDSTAIVIRGATKNVEFGGDILLNNNELFLGKDAGGVGRTLIYISAGDDVLLGGGNIDDMLFSVGGFINALVLKQISGNLGIRTISQFGNGAGVIGIANAATNPSANPTGGGVLYADAGAGKWRGSGGTTTTFGPAEPHCPDCGRDFVLEWENQKFGHLQVCMWCATEQMTQGVIERVKY